MNRTELKKKIRVSSIDLLEKKGYVSSADLLIELGFLSLEDYENWRFGRVPYLEKVCRGNLKKLSFIIKELKIFSREKGLKPSWTAYNKWGKGPKKRLQFSKSGDSIIEKGYATHYVKKR